MSRWQLAGFCCIQSDKVGPFWRHIAFVENRFYPAFRNASTAINAYFWIDGKEVAKKPNLYWHLPMHVTLSLGLRYPFVAYKDGERVRFGTPGLVCKEAWRPDVT